MFSFFSFSPLLALSPLHMPHETISNLGRALTAISTCQSAITILETKIELQNKELKDLRQRDRDREDAITLLKKKDEARAKDLVIVNRKVGAQEEEDVESLSWIWRAIVGIGGSVSAVMAMNSFVKTDERMAWMSAMFWPFSATCLILGTPNPRDINKFHEKAILALGCVLVGVTPCLGSIMWTWKTRTLPISCFIQQDCAYLVEHLI